MELVRWEPFEGLDRIQSRISELFDDSFARARAYTRSAAGYLVPPVDILESRDAYLIRAEVPGMKKDDFKLEVRDGTMTLSGERKQEELADGVEYHRTERVMGKFTRSFHLRKRSNKTRSRPITETASWKPTFPRLRKPSRDRSRSA